MENRNQIVLTSVALLASIAIIIILINSLKNQKNKLIDKEKEYNDKYTKIQEENLLLQLEFLKNQGVNPEILKTIENLINNFQPNEKITSELNEILNLTKDKHIKSAFIKLSKLLERLLFDKFNLTDEYKKYCKEKKKQIDNFDTLIEYSKEINFFDEKDYHYSKLIKKIRNIETHELSPDILDEINTCFVGAIKIIENKFTE